MPLLTVSSRRAGVHLLARTRATRSLSVAVPAGAPGAAGAAAGAAAAAAAAAAARPVDVLIVGGGLVGGSLAAALAANPLSRPLSVVVVDPAPPPSPPLRGSAPSLRMSTIAPSSARFLRDAGVWDRVPPARRAEFHHMLVWDRPEGGPRADGAAGRLALGAIRFDDADLDIAGDVDVDRATASPAPPAPSGALGYVVDNDTLRAAVFEQLHHLIHHNLADLSIQQTAVDSVSYFDPPDFSSDVAHRFSAAGAEESAHSAAQPRWPIVQLANGQAYSARLIIAADGARSRIRALASFDWYLHSYDQTAVVANVELDRPITTAYQRFLSTGPVAVLPVASDAADRPLANIIWTTTPTEAAALSSASDVVFVDELNLALHDPDDDRSAFGEATGSATSRGLDHVIDLPVPTGQFPWSDSVGDPDSPLPVPRATAIVGARGRFPLSVGHAPRYVDPDRRTVLVGDAAHNVHPLAGQGVNLGFADASALVQALAVAAGTGRDIGGEDGAPLMRYERDRVAANVVMLGTLHTIHTLFAMNAWTPFRVARRIGVSALDNLGPVKKLILRAMA